MLPGSLLPCRRECYNKPKHFAQKASAIFIGTKVILMLKFIKLLPRFDQAGDMATASSSINDAKNAGSSAINSYDPTAAGNTSTGAVSSNFNTAQSQNRQAVDPLSAVIKSNPSVTSLYQQGNQLYNVPQLANLATNLTNQVNNAVPAGYGGARGFDISSDQINNGVASKLAYLTPQENAATANYNTAAGLASNFVNAGIQQNEQNLIPAQENASLTAQNQAAEATGWNQAQKATLDGLMAKMQSGVQLSEQEMQTAQALAATEESYNAQIASNQAGIQEANIGNQFKSIPAGQNLVNTFAHTIMNPSMLTSKTGLAKYG